MRYIIIPGLIILYLLWSYYSIKDFINYGDFADEFSYFWLFSVLGILVFISIKYW